MSYTKELQAAYQLARYHRKRKERISVLGGKCIKCGSTDKLEIDHVDPDNKEVEVSRSWDILAIESELEKCQLLCHDCHIAKTIKEQQSVDHGTWGMYQGQHCRCADCRNFFNEYRRNWRLNRVRGSSSGRTGVFEASY